MKKRLILILALCLIIFSFAGCRKLGSAANSAVSGLTGAASGTVSKVGSEGKLLESAVSGTVSAITSSK